MNPTGKKSEKTDHIALILFSRCLEHGKWPDRLEFAKYLYLLDWSLCRYSGARATEIDWYFFHYGPWSPDLIPVCATVQDHFRLGWIDYSDEERGVPAFDPITDKLSLTIEGVIARILRGFATRDVSFLVDFCYRLTEPMQNARRGERLDFSTVETTSEVPAFVPPTRSLAMPQLTAAQLTARERAHVRGKSQRSLVDTWRRACEKPAYEQAMNVLAREIEHDISGSATDARVRITGGMLDHLDALRDG